MLFDKSYHNISVTHFMKNLKFISFGHLQNNQDMETHFNWILWKFDLLFIQLQNNQLDSLMNSQTVHMSVYKMLYGANIPNQSFKNIMWEGGGYPNSANPRRVAPRFCQSSGGGPDFGRENQKTSILSQVIFSEWSLIFWSEMLHLYRVIVLAGDVVQWKQTIWAASMCQYGESAVFADLS